MNGLAPFQKPRSPGLARLFGTHVGFQAWGNQKPRLLTAEPPPNRATFSFLAISDMTFGCQYEVKLLGVHGECLHETVGSPRPDSRCCFGLPKRQPIPDHRGTPAGGSFFTSLFNRVSLWDAPTNRISSNNHGSGYSVSRAPAQSLVSWTQVD